MNLFSVAIAGPVTAFLMNSTAFAAVTDLTPSPIAKIFVPSGFDDNDNVEIVMQGYHRNTCMKIGPTSYTVDLEKKIITVAAQSYTYPDDFFCAQVMTPFLQIVKVGILPKGTYDVRYAYDSAVAKSFSVHHRMTEAPDDYLYAPIDQASIEVDSASGKQSLLLEGSFPILLHGCWIVRDVRVARDTQDVVLVQPISEIVDTSECATHSSPDFKVITALPQAFYGEGLLHVRVLNGNSINRFINNPT